jgi:hypothetical protein
VYARTLNGSATREFFAEGNGGGGAELKKAEADAVWDEAGYERRMAQEKAQASASHEVRLVREAYHFLGAEARRAEDEAARNAELCALLEKERAEAAAREDAIEEAAARAAENAEAALRAQAAEASRAIAQLASRAAKQAAALTRKLELVAEERAEAEQNLKRTKKRLGEMTDELEAAMEAAAHGGISAHQLPGMSDDPDHTSLLDEVVKQVTGYYGGAPQGSHAPSEPAREVTDIDESVLLRIRLAFGPEEDTPPRVVWALLAHCAELLGENSKLEGRLRLAESGAGTPLAEVVGAAKAVDLHVCSRLEGLPPPMRCEWMLAEAEGVAEARRHQLTLGEARRAQAEVAKGELRAAEDLVGLGGGGGGGGGGGKGSGKGGGGEDGSVSPELMALRGKAAALREEAAASSRAAEKCGAAFERAMGRLAAEAGTALVARRDCMRARFGQLVRVERAAEALLAKQQAEERALGMDDGGGGDDGFGGAGGEADEDSDDDDGVRGDKDQQEAMEREATLPPLGCVHAVAGRLNHEATLRQLRLQGLLQGVSQRDRPFELEFVLKMYCDASSIAMRLTRKVTKWGQRTRGRAALPGLKPLRSTVRKAHAYCGGQYARVLDVSRAALRFADAEALAAALRVITADEEILVEEVLDRLSDAHLPPGEEVPGPAKSVYDMEDEGEHGEHGEGDGGSKKKVYDAAPAAGFTDAVRALYRDVVVHFTFPGATGTAATHVSELQLRVDAFEELREGDAPPPPPEVEEVGEEGEETAGDGEEGRRKLPVPDEDEQEEPDSDDEVSEGEEEEQRIKTEDEAAKTPAALLGGRHTDAFMQTVALVHRQEWL